MAKIGGMTTEEMNKLEEEFLLSIDFDLYVNPDEYHSIIAHVFGNIAEEIVGG